MCIRDRPGKNRINKILYFCPREHYYLTKTRHKTHFSTFLSLGLTVHLIVHFSTAYILWDCLRGSTRPHPFTVPLHHSHQLRHAQNYGQVGVRHRLAEAEPLNGLRLCWWHSDSGGGRERMPRDDYQGRGTKCTSWTEYKPGKKRRPWESPSAHHHSQ